MPIFCCDSSFFSLFSRKVFVLISTHLKTRLRYPSIFVFWAQSKFLWDCSFEPPTNIPRNIIRLTNSWILFPEKYDVVYRLMLCLSTLNKECLQPPEKIWIFSSQIIEKIIRSTSITLFAVITPADRYSKAI